MSFVWKAAQPLRTPEQIMAVIIQTVDELNMPDKRGAAICAGMCVAQESDFWCPWNAADPESKNYPYDSQSDDGRSCGYYQQQKGPDGALWWGPTSQEMDVHLSTREFLTRLKKVGYNASGAQAANDSVQAVQRSGVPQGYLKHWDHINTLYDSVIGGAAQETPVTDPRIVRLLAVRPDFNEFSNWCQRADGKANWQDRGGVTIDCFLAHTQEASEDDDNAALDLSNFLKSTIGGANPVSYHDSVHQASDGGVTVVNSVDTDYAAWAVGNSNNRSINRCFAGSKASWTRAQWLQQSKAIDVMAYLMVLDAVKYNSNAPEHVTFGPNYDGKPPPVFSDHRYCTKVLRDGNNHVDCGDNFPADIYGSSVAKYWAAANATTAPTPQEPPVTQPAKPTPVGPADDQITLRWNCLGGHTLVEALAQVRDKVCGTNDRDKPGAL